MNNDTNNQEAYRAAYDEATEELKQIFGKIEQLHLRKVRVEKAMELLGRRIGSERPAPVFKVRRKTHLPGLTVKTQLTVVPLVSAVPADTNPEANPGPEAGK
jgi:hypothetical protein